MVTVGDTAQAAPWPALLLFAAGFALLLLVERNWLKPGGREPSRNRLSSHTATRGEVQRAVGRRRLRSDAATLLPGRTGLKVRDVGYRIGTSRGVTCHASIEDSVVILGPPRSGKGLHLAIPLILDAPGAVVTTSTRPDNLAVTLRSRRATGPVAVFDPQGLATGIRSSTRWSPIRGCRDPHVAMIRAKGLTSGGADGTTDSNFWQASAEQAVRCLLHAADLGGRTSRDLYRWSLSAIHASEAVHILATHESAAHAWDQALDGILNADPRQRDSVWAMVTIAFNALGDPTVLDALCPDAGEDFDPDAFLAAEGTVYLLGTSTGATATSGIVAAFIEEIVEAARRRAARSAGARLDPPLSLVLDEAANYPLPSLPSLMSDGGGTGISTIVVLQSLAQARHVWSEHAAQAIWDAAIVKIILGGGSNARDLDDLSRLIGQREKTATSTSRSVDGRRSTSTSNSKVPIVEPAQLRTLPFGSAILLMRAAPAIALTLHPWTKRTAAKQLTADRAAVEAEIRSGVVGAPRTAA